MPNVLITWTLLFICYKPSETLMITGLTRSLKAYVDHVIKPILNISSNEQKEKSPQYFNIDPKLSTTLKEYLDHLPFSNEDNLHQNIQSKNSSNGNIVIMTRIGDYNTETAEGGKWIEVSGNYSGSFDMESNNSLSSTAIKNAIKRDSNNFTGENNIEEYANNYQDFLFTFKDLVNIGLNPKITDNIIQKQHSETFNATYIMSIPKSTKFFEFKVSNLTQEQYNELNDLVKMHFQKNKQNSTSNSDTEYKNIFLGKKDEKRQISSIDLNKSSSMQFVSENSPQLNGEVRGTWNKLPSEINIPLHQLFTENNYETFKNIINKNVSANKNTASNITGPSVMNNNGFHAEIATDYMHTNDEGKEPIIKKYSSNENRRYSGLFNNTNLNNQFDKEWLTNINDSVITSLLLKIIEQQQLVKQNELYNSRTSSVSDDTTKGGALNKSSDLINLSTKKPIYEPELKSMRQPQVFDNSADLNNTNQMNTYSDKLNLKMTNSSITDENKVNNSSYLNVISNMEGQGLNVSYVNQLTTNKETQKRNNIDKSFLTDFFHNNGSYLLDGEEDDAKVMKINRQGNILEELKMLMLEYFVSLQLNTQNVNNYSLIVEDILNSTNLFELMQRSSQFVKHNLKLKVQNEKKEPSTFVKRIIDTQVDRCKIRYNGIAKSMNGTLNRNASQNSFKRNSRRRFMNLTKCIASKVRECVIGFNNWLAKGKFYLRPHFKLQRAYEHYEIETNLFCLRKYNGTYLDSNLHGIRIWPGPKKGKMSGMRRLKPGNRKFMLKKARKVNEGRKAHKGNLMARQNSRMANNTFRNNQLGKYQQENFQRYSGKNRHNRLNVNEKSINS